ncbi:MAG: hypothetical protein CVV51_00065 [Spirochaetae bacterium HGW-Spirochaetae-7]|jgi:hypothetical protein|nr:MAG: hypothetical protein CVV51_00065 [Spirochaetae bacterium HGW-Spirochaetae-7]
MLGVAASGAILIAMLASSCWHPTFDPMISASEVTVRKLGDPTLYFSVEDVQQHGMDDAWFLPPMVDLPANGLLVQDMDERIGFKPVLSIDSLNHTGWIDTMTGFEIENTMGDAYLIYADPDGSSDAFVTLGTSEGRILPMTAPNTSSATVLPDTDAMWYFGIGAVAVNGSLNATLTCITYQAMVPNYQQKHPWPGGDPVFVIGPGPTLLFSDVTQIATPGKLLDTTGSTNNLYLSCGLSDGSNAIFRWDTPFTAAQPTRYPESFGPLIGALSDGRLLAEDNGIVSVLDAGLNRLFKFPAGRLRFVHERWNGIEMKVVFTRTLFVRNNNDYDKGSLQVEVYEIPTADLARLDD